MWVLGNSAPAGTQGFILDRPHRPPEGGAGSWDPLPLPRGLSSAGILSA